MVFYTLKIHLTHNWLYTNKLQSRVIRRIRNLLNPVKIGRSPSNSPATSTSIFSSKEQSVSSCLRSLDNQKTNNMKDEKKRTLKDKEH